MATQHKKGFQFTDNPNANINAFAEGRLELMFGVDWENRKDVELVLAVSNAVHVAERKQGGWELRVYTGEYADAYTVSCLKNDKLEDPVANVAASVKFFSSGCPSAQTHYSSGKHINPPDGNPSNISYSENGIVLSCWYVGDRKTSSLEEVAKRVEAAKQTNLAKLCDVPQEIIALSASKSHLPQGDPRSPSPTNPLF